MKHFFLALFVCVAVVACGDDPSSAEPPQSSSVAESSSEQEVESSSSEPASSESSSSEALSSEAQSSSSKDLSSSSEFSSSAEPPLSSSVAESSSEQEIVSSSSVQPASSDDGKCTKCDSYTAADPELTENGGKGSVTTYGSVTAKETSLGGACNYGQTNIQYYAAIHVNVSPGDNRGPWQGGSACGGCVHVKAKTPDGWKEVAVRITDRCPDANCGVDLGGAPASDIMGILVGRYYGEWEFVSCEGVDGVWGDSTSLWVKEGASEHWSVIQVRNPRDMVKSIVISGIDKPGTYTLETFDGAENFWTVPGEVLQSAGRFRVVATYRTGKADEWQIKGSDLAVPEANLYAGSR